MTAESKVQIAKLWAERLDIAGWPTIWRVDDISEPDITIGDRDIVTIPAAVSSEPEILRIVLAYAYHNVDDEQRPTDEQIRGAAADLTLNWLQEA